MLLQLLLPLSASSTIGHFTIINHIFEDRINLNEENLKYAAEMGRIKVLNLHVTEVSSTEIREKLKNGEGITGLVPEALKVYKGNVVCMCEKQE